MTTDRLFYLLAVIFAGIELFIGYNIIMYREIMMVAIFVIVAIPFISIGIIADRIDRGVG